MKYWTYKIEDEVKLLLTIKFFEDNIASLGKAADPRGIVIYEK